MLETVWSFWGKPHQIFYQQNWLSKKTFLLSWALSYELAITWSKKTVLYTDSIGAEILVEGLGLKFDELDLGLNQYRDDNENWWVLGKLHAYQSQNVPFLHLDYDTFIWKPLPQALLSADVFAQSVERLEYLPQFIYPRMVYKEYFKYKNGFLPEEWAWYDEQPDQKMLTMSIFGGCNLDLIGHYANETRKFISCAENVRIWEEFGDKGRESGFVEQYMMKACLEYYSSVDKRFGDLRIEHLFQHGLKSLRSETDRLGYAHLGAMKNVFSVMRKLENRVMRDYPKRYKRLESLLDKK